MGDVVVAGLSSWPPDDARVQCPHAMFAELRERAPVYRVPERTPEGVDVYVVSSWGGCAQVLMEAETFINDLTGLVPPHISGILPAPEPETPTFYHDHNIFFSYGEDHRLKRQWGLRLGERKRLPQFQALIEEEVDAAIAAFADAGSCDFREQFTLSMPLRAVRRLLDLPDDIDPLMRDMANAIAATENNPDVTPEQLDELDRSLRAVLERMAAVVHERYEDPGEDYISEIVAMQVERDGALDPNALARQLAVTLFGADHVMGGHLADVLVLLAREPELQERVRVDPSLIRGLHFEALRDTSPVPWMLRQCVEDREVDGVTIQAGSLVVVSLVSGNWDPAEFPEPDRIDIGRGNVEKNQLSLGRGPHRCLGASIARIFCEVTVSRMLETFDDIRLDESSTDLTPELSHAFRILPAVRLTFVRRA